MRVFGGGPGLGVRQTIWFLEIGPNYPVCVRGRGVLGGGGGF